MPLEPTNSEKDLGRTLLLQALADISSLQATVSTAVQQNQLILQNQTDDRLGRRAIYEKLDSMNARLIHLEEGQERIAPMVEAHERYYNQAAGVTIAIRMIWLGLAGLIGALGGHFISVIWPSK